MSNSVRPHRWQPTRLPHPWDSPGKNTGVGCHFLLQCVKVKSESVVSVTIATVTFLNLRHLSFCFILLKVFLFVHLFQKKKKNKQFHISCFCLVSISLIYALAFVNISSLLLTLGLVGYCSSSLRSKNRLFEIFPFS